MSEDKYDDENERSSQRAAPLQQEDSLQRE